MTLRFVSLMLLSMVSVNAFGEKKLAYDKNGYPYVKGEMLIKVRSRAALERFLDNSAPTLESFSERKELSRSDQGSWYKVKVNEALESVNVLHESLQSEGVEYAEPNYVYSIHLGPGDRNPSPNKPAPDIQPAPKLPTEPVADPELGQLYGLKKISVESAWATTAGSRDVIVADIDTGIDYNHVDLANNLWRNAKEIEGNNVDDDGNGYVDDVVGYNFREKNGRPFDDNEHGTHTAGTIAATGGNGVGISGVAKSASVMTLRFLGGAQGSGTAEDAILAIDYATRNGASIMSNSWGGGGFSQAMYDSIKRSNEKGILFVAAAGNSSSNNDSRPSYPASYDIENVISIAATDSSDALAYFSNYGAKSVHLAAPGVNTFSTIPGNKYKAMSGTSMATPHVSGAAVLLKSAFPKLSARELKALLLESVDSVAGLSGKTVTGGRLNVARALELATERHASARQ